MSKFFLAVATILSLSTRTAMAKPAPVGQTTQTASNQIDVRGSDAIPNRSQLDTGRDGYPGTTTGAHATRPADWDQEPESISGGTEP